MLHALLEGQRNGVAPGVLAWRFHRWLAEVIAGVAARAGEKTVVLSGGCFQNRLLLETTVERLRGLNVDVFWPREIPPNDGGLSLGQAVIAAARLKNDQAETKDD